jgi:hypothetical protein
VTRLTGRPWLFGFVVGAAIAVVWAVFILRGSATVRVVGGVAIGALWGGLQAEVASYHNRHRRSG